MINVLYQSFYCSIAHCMCFGVPLSIVNHHFSLQCSPKYYFFFGIPAWCVQHHSHMLLLKQWLTTNTLPRHFPCFSSSLPWNQPSFRTSWLPLPCPSYLFCPLLPLLLYHICRLKHLPFLFLCDLHPKPLNFIMSLICCPSLLLTCRSNCLDHPKQALSSVTMPGTLDQLTPQPKPLTRFLFSGPRTEEYTRWSASSFTSSFLSSYSFSFVLNYSF